MAKTTYIYTPTSLELYTRSQNIPDGLPVRLSKAPFGGKGLPRKYRWVENLDGEFLGMVLANSLIPQSTYEQEPEIFDITFNDEDKAVATRVS